MVVPRGAGLGDIGLLENDDAADASRWGSSRCTCNGASCRASADFGPQARGRVLAEGLGPDGCMLVPQARMVDRSAATGNVSAVDLDRARWLNSGQDQRFNAIPGDCPRGSQKGWALCGFPMIFVNPDESWSSNTKTFGYDQQICPCVFQLF